MLVTTRNYLCELDIGIIYETDATVKFLQSLSNSTQIAQNKLKTKYRISQNKNKLNEIKFILLYHASFI